MVALKLRLLHQDCLPGEMVAKEQVIGNDDFYELEGEEKKAAVNSRGLRLGPTHKLMKSMSLESIFCIESTYDLALCVKPRLGL